MVLSIARKHIERLYFDRATIIEYQSVTDPETHTTNMQEVVVYENVPCKLSYHMPQTSGEGVASSLSFLTTILLSPDLVIKPGSKLLVTRNGVTTAYSNSGQPAIHFNHQEIQLQLWDKWA